MTLETLKTLGPLKTLATLETLEPLGSGALEVSPPSGISSPQRIDIIRWGIEGYVDSVQKFRQIGGPSELRIFGV